MFVSLNGRSPSTLAAFVERCRARGVKVIEDAAQSLGSFHGGRHLGTIGDCGCLSFSSQKIVTTGQGGAVLTDDDALFERMGLLRDFGRREGGSDHYLSVGWNLKFTDLQAVIGVSQMRRLAQIVERKRAIFDALSRAARRRIAASSYPETDLSRVTPWFVDVLMRDVAEKRALMAYLTSHGIGSRPFYPPLHAEPAFSAAGAISARRSRVRRRVVAAVVAAARPTPTSTASAIGCAPSAPRGHRNASRVTIASAMTRLASAL